MSNSAARPRAARRRVLVPAAVVALATAMAVALLGCTTEPYAAPPSPAPTSPTADAGDGPSYTATPRGGTCGLVTQREVTLVADRQLGPPRPVATSGDPALPACRWGSLSGVGLQVVAVPAGRWALGLPPIVDQLRVSGFVEDSDLLQRLSSASVLVESGDRVPDGQGCALFADLLTATGTGPARDVAVALPSPESPDSVVAQTCLEGTFVGLLLARPGLQRSDAGVTVDRMARLRDRVARRATG